MNLIVIDLSVKKTSPAGSCVLSELKGLSERYSIHLLSTEADTEVQTLVNFYKINSPKIPLVLRYIIFSGRVKWKMKSLLKKIHGPYIIQTTQGQYTNSTISYPHFCHRAYLKKHWKDSSITGLRRVLRKLNHLYHSRMEASAFEKAKVIVAPSKGLARELIETYPFSSNKIQVIANPVDVQHFAKPLTHNKTKERNQFGIADDDIVIAFAALGDFARKGLPELMNSLREDAVQNTPFKILVVGGKTKEIRRYEKLAQDLGIIEKLIFVGFRNDIRPLLWMSDIFALPSSYEIFSLVCIQAAAAGLPIMATPLHGVEEYIEDGKNGWLIERNATAIAHVLSGIEKGNFDLDKMGENAFESVRKYDHMSFRQKWESVYASLLNSNTASA